MNKVKRFFKKFWKWLIEMPARAKHNWIAYKAFVKAEYFRQRDFLDGVLGVERNKEAKKDGK